MIIVRFTSGLGNQMFQYNLYSLLRERFRDVPVKADLSWFYRFSEHQGYELSRLFGENPDFVIDEATDSEIISCSGRIPNRLKGRAGEVWQFILRVPHRLIRMFDTRERTRIEQTGFEDNAEIFEQIEAIDPAKNYYITGFFIEEIYWEGRLEYLRRAFRFPEGMGEKNRDLAGQISRTVSVSVHVRRGDYLSPKYSGSFLPLGEDYYKRAVSLARERFPGAVFFIFSDDKEYIKKAFDWLDEKVIATGNTGDESFRDMQLMSMCRANIIANSTFSVWAGILNRNEDRLVIYPASYMREKDTQEITLPGWVRL